MADPSDPAQLADLYRQHIYVGAGVLAFFTALALGISSLPSVSSSLTWREFRTFQSVLGWLCLALATTHCASNGMDRGPDRRFHLFVLDNNCYFLSYEQMALLLPVLTIALKLPLLIPVVDIRLTKIRAGFVYK